MRTDYFDDLLPDSVTRVTQPKTESVTPEPDSATQENSNLCDASRMSRMSRTNKDSTEENEAITEYLAERAAIHEYDAGMTRKAAEAEARRALQVYEYRLTDDPATWLVMIAPGQALDQARESLQLRFSGRLLDVRPYELQGAKKCRNA